MHHANTGLSLRQSQICCTFEPPESLCVILLNSIAGTGAGLFAYLFPMVLFGTFVETGTAMIHGVNERIDHVLRERGRSLSPWFRVAVALVILLSAMVIADVVGLTALVARGYGIITYGFLVVFVVPVMTVGIWKQWKLETGS